MTDPAAVRQLLVESGVSKAQVVATDGMQPLRSPEDWWTIALGSGLRWTIDQMGPAPAAQVRDANLAWLRQHRVEAIETNFIYATARK